MTPGLIIDGEVISTGKVISADEIKKKNSLHAGLVKKKLKGKITSPFKVRTKKSKKNFL